MKILLANKFYYRRGGDCIYTINLEELLKAHGHEVAVFAMQHPENLPNRWSRFWPSEIEIRSSSNIMETLVRPFGSREVKRKFREIVEAFRPDVVHANIIHTHLSPVIMEIAKERGIRTVWTMHEYKLLCPRYVCLRNGEVCELCFRHGGSQRWHDLLHCIGHKCMKGSVAYSLVGYMEALHWSTSRLRDMTDVFICPSQFMADIMVRGGFPASKMKVVSHYIDTEKCNGVTYEKGDYYCYFGRLSEEKGLRTLIRAANKVPEHRLVVVGDGPMRSELENMAKGHIRFIGAMGWDGLKQIVGRARFTVVPSEWYEVGPLTAMESLCLGTPVLGARIGNIPSLIDEPTTGLTFESGNTDDLESKIRRMFEADFDYGKIAFHSRGKYDAETYYHQIMDIYAPINHTLSTMQKP